MKLTLSCSEAVSFEKLGQHACSSDLWTDETVSQPKSWPVVAADRADRSVACLDFLYVA